MGVSFHGSKAILSLASTRYASISLYQSPKTAGHNGAFNRFEVAFLRRPQKYDKEESSEKDLPKCI